MKYPRASLACCLLVPVAFASAPDVDVLYSNQFTFTRDGVPQHRIRVRQGLDSVEVGGSDLLLRAGANSGAEIRTGADFIVRVVSSTPARVRYWVVAERHAPDDAEGAAQAASRLRNRAKEVKIVEVGSLFAVGGRTIDGRRLLVTLGPYPTADEARTQARTLGLEPDLFEELVERPRGILEAESKTTRVRTEDVVWFSTRDGAVRAAGAVYSGEIYVSIDRDGHLAVVNVVDEDRLLAGLLPAEMPASAPMEALKAQAVAARTELLAQIGERHLADPYRLCGETHCHVYRGTETVHPRANQAVAATRGQVMLEDRGPNTPARLVDARWSACCGGHTEDNERVWPGAPSAQLRGRPDGAVQTPKGGNKAASRLLSDGTGAFCSLATAKFRWSQTVDPANIGERNHVGLLRDLEVMSRGTSGRATAIRLIGTTATRTVEGELAIRQALGGLKSSLFVVEHGAKEQSSSVPAAIVLRGGGHGHGVGMCQTGAMGRAQAGHDYRKILQHYYSGSLITRLY